MPFGGFLRQSTAVDVLIGPFVDSTDGVTPETALTIDVELSKNGQTLGNKSDATTPVHEATGTIDGYYNCELDATDTNTVGQLTVACFAAGALQVRHDYQVVEEAIYDALYAASATGLLPANVTQWNGSAVATPSVAGVPEVDLTHVAGATTNVAALATNVDAILTDTSTIGTPSNLGSGASIAANLVDIEGQTDDIGAAGAGLTAITNRLPAALVGGRMDADVGAVATSTSAATNLARHANGVVLGAVSGAGSTTTVVDTGLSEATDDHYNGRVIVFTSGALAGQVADITDYNGTTKQLTVSTLTEAPADTNQFVIV